jgi:hypothetical protein
MKHRIQTFGLIGWLLFGFSIGVKAQTACEQMVSALGAEYEIQPQWLATTAPLPASMAADWPWHSNLLGYKVYVLPAHIERPTPCSKLVLEGIDFYPVVNNRLYHRLGILHERVLIRMRSTADWQAWLENGKNDAVDWRLTLASQRSGIFDLQLTRHADSTRLLQFYDLAQPWLDLEQRLQIEWGSEKVLPLVIESRYQKR